MTPTYGEAFVMGERMAFDHRRDRVALMRRPARTDSEADRGFWDGYTPRTVAWATSAKPAEEVPMMASDVSDVDDTPSEQMALWRIRRERMAAAANLTLDHVQAGRLVDEYAAEWAEGFLRGLGADRCCKCGREGHLSKDCTWPNESQKG